MIGFLDKKMFNRPKWLKPELDIPKYWIHLLILVFIVYYLVNTFVEPMQITLENVSLGILFLAIADTIAHTLLKLD